MNIKKNNDPVSPVSIHIHKIIKSDTEKFKKIKKI
jgi:hypothetical protein